MLRMMLMTKLKTIAAALLGAGVVTAGATGLAFQAPGGPTQAVQTEGRPQAESEEPGTGFNPSAGRETTTRTVQPGARSPQNTGDELELLNVQLTRKLAEIRRAEAQVDMAKALVARNARLISRDPNHVSKEEQIKAEGEVAIANAEREIKRAEVREVELRIEQAMRRQPHPDGPAERSDPPASLTSPAALEQKLREMDRKADRLIEASRGPGAEKAARPSSVDEMAGGRRGGWKPAPAIEDRCDRRLALCLRRAGR
jgi:hypothetical protein